MITMKFALIAMMIGSSMYAPLDTEHMALPIEQPAAQMELLHHACPNARTDAVRAGAIEDIVIERPYINKDKTYEQVMAEAFERIYAEINRMLDQIPETCEEQFQLQRMV